MPFTASEFLDVFAAYNRAVWPLVGMLWLLTVLVMVAALPHASTPPMRPRLLLAGHWLWAGIVYHALFFTAINPAAWLFASMFVTQGAMLVTFPSSERSGNVRPGSVRRVVSSVFVLYGLLYPAIAWADGFAYPRMPTFGVPCPTVMLTVGFLIATSTHSIRLSAIPIAWSFIGGTAAWLLGVHADLALPVGRSDAHRRSDVSKESCYEETVPCWCFDDSAGDARHYAAPLQSSPRLLRTITGSRPSPRRRA